MALGRVSSLGLYYIYKHRREPTPDPRRLSAFFRGVSLACRRPSRAPGVCGLRPELYLCIEGGRGRLLLQSALKGGGGGRLYGERENAPSLWRGDLWTYPLPLSSARLLTYFRVSEL